MFDTEHNIAIFSGHDYTLLSVMGSLQLIDKLSHAPNFGCYMIFELWDDTPPTHPSNIDKNGDVIQRNNGKISRGKKNTAADDRKKDKTDEVSNNCYHNDILLCKPVKADTRILRILHNPCPIGKFKYFWKWTFWSYK
jgi:hypothetical protein